MTLSVFGAGAFGTSLAIALAKDGTDVVLWGRDPEDIARMHSSRQTGRRLPGFELPENLTVTSDLGAVPVELCLLAVPMQNLSEFLDGMSKECGALIACCKGVDQSTGLGPVATISRSGSTKTAAMLTGPSFAQDIAAGLPTALVLACEDDALGHDLQKTLTRPALRVYRSTDVIGAELGGALKNVIALAAGMTHGAGLGDSARASVIARGFSEMTRYAATKGALVDTLHGLSGLGDLVLTCTSEKSRNFAAGIALGKGEAPSTSTIEGLATARAIAKDAERIELELPLIATVAKVVSGDLDISSAVATLLARPAGRE